jgi:hypothetical protein
MAETLTDPMAGYDPNRTDAPQPAAPAQPADYEFDPKKEIDPMANKFFADTNADRSLTPEFRNRIQSQYLQGMTDIQAQRDKIESERLRNIMDRQTIEARNQAFAETRRKQEDAARAAENQRIGTETVNGILASGLPPEEQRKQIAAYEVNNAAKIVTDPALKYALDAAKGQIPVPTEPLYSTKDMRDKMEKGVPPKIAMGGNPVEIGYYERFAAAQEKEMSDKLEDRKAAAKEYRSTIMDLAKEPPSFMTADQASAAGVAVQPIERGGDPNALKYLTPESQQRGRILIGLLKGSAGLAEFEKLSDADKREAIMVAQRDAMLQALQKADTVSDTDEEDVTVDSLLTPKKR